MENYAELLGSIIGLVIFLVIIVIGIIIYNKIMFPIPDRDTIIREPYFLRDRYKTKRILRFADDEDLNNFKEYLLGLGFQPLSNDEDIWYLKNESGEFYLHLGYNDQLAQITIFAESIFAMSKIDLLLEKILLQDG